MKNCGSDGQQRVSEFDSDIDVRISLYTKLLALPPFDPQLLWFPRLNSTYFHNNFNFNVNILPISA